ncbi:MAG: hypothetical protein EOP00_34265 [Pedobacter sp.]|nr:MAG: hypothetical protein EOP00_34265 [Pedobacter sp.]
MKKSKFYLYLTIAAFVFSFFTWFLEIIGLSVIILMVILCRNELNNKAIAAGNHNIEEIKYLKTAKLLAILSIIISSLILLYGLCILVIVTMGFFGF